ncbi:MAG TPA: FMN-binding protein [Streptosporangiaceae bacterium]
MRRWPIVVGGTVAGLVGVLTFHTSPSRLVFTSTPAMAAPAGATARTGSQSPSGGAAGSGPSGGANSGTGSGSGGTQAGGVRTAVGSKVNYYFGVLAVRVTVSGNKIVKVGIASLNDGGNPRSQYIDSQSIPMLEQQVMQVQSARIQGVSGASYTSAGFAQSLQSALHALGLR